MAKSLRSKWKRKMKVIKRVRYGAKEDARLKSIVEAGNLRKLDEANGVILKTAKDIQKVESNFFPKLADRMETPLVVSDHKATNMKNEHGNYPKWMSKTKIDKLKKVVKKKKAVKKLGQKKAKV